MFFVLTLALISPVSALAKTKAGTKSGSFFYFFDKAFEKTNLFFTFRAEKKAKKALEYADERLAEAEESASENKPEAVAEAMENYQENIEVLEKVLNKVPEEAKEAIEKAIEASKERQEEETEEVIEKANELEKEISEIKKETEEADNEIKEEENDDEEENEEETGKKDEQKKEIEKLKKEVEALKQKQPQVKIIEKIIEKSAVVEKKESSSSQTSSQTKQNENIVTLPNGAVVEMDANGNVVRTIKESPEQAYTPRTTDNANSLSVSISVIKITSSSVHLEWKTNIPTDSKIFLNQPDGSIKVISSASGNSTIHFVDITNLISGTSYSYTIETITGTQSKKIDGYFITNAQTFTAESIKSPTGSNDTVPFLKFSSDRPFTIKKLVFLYDGSYCQSGYPFTFLSLQNLTQSKDSYKDSNNKFIFDFPDGLISSSIIFRLSAGTDNQPSSYCVYNGMKFVLRDSESIIFGENGQQIEVPHLILVGK